MYQFHFRIPPYYTLLVRSLSVLEVRWADRRACLALGRVGPAATYRCPPLQLF